VRSLHAHGRIVAVDCEAARARPGVHAVLIGADIADLVDPFPMIIRDGAEVAPIMHPVLARGRVRYVGEPPALVAADTAEQVTHAAEWVAVDVDERPPLVEPRDAEAAPSGRRR
jgi:carbon-monoxide dehydrogenase large subunit